MLNTILICFAHWIWLALSSDAFSPEHTRNFPLPLTHSETLCLSVWRVCHMDRQNVSECVSGGRKLRAVCIVEGENYIRVRKCIPGPLTSEVTKWRFLSKPLRTYWIRRRQFASMQVIILSM